MDDSNKIPCSVAILTFNSEKTLKRALESARHFAEIIVCDGGSNDRTLEIARSFRSVILPQDPAFKDKEGRIKDFSGVHNQALKASAYDWHFYLDSDEVLTKELIEEIRGIIAANVPSAFWVDRKYEIDSKVIDCAATYPTRQMRFFHKGAVTEFIKPIHERINPKPEAVIKTTRNFMLVPVSSNPNVWREKWKHYISLEVARRGKISTSDWLGVCAENLKVSALYIFRYIRNYLFCRGSKMAWLLEWERHVYHWDLSKALRSNIDR